MCPIYVHVLLWHQWWRSMHFALLIYVGFPFLGTLFMWSLGTETVGKGFLTNPTAILHPVCFSPYDLFSKNILCRYSWNCCCFSTERRKPKWSCAPPVPTSFCQAFKFSNSRAILTPRSFSILSGVFLLQQTCRQQEGVSARLLWVTECFCCEKLDAWWYLFGRSRFLLLLIRYYSWFQGLHSCVGGAFCLCSCGAHLVGGTIWRWSSHVVGA